MFRFPFDWKTPFGYIFVITFESIVAYLLLLIAALEMGFGFALMCVFFGFSKDIQADLIDFNKFVRMKNGLKMQIYKKMCELSQYQSDIKQLSL